MSDPDRAFRYYPSVPTKNDYTEAPPEPPPMVAEPSNFWRTNGPTVPLYAKHLNAWNENDPHYYAHMVPYTPHSGAYLGVMNNRPIAKAAGVPLDFQQSERLNRKG